MDLVLRSYNVSHRFTDLTGKKLSCFKIIDILLCFRNPYQILLKQNVIFHKQKKDMYRWPIVAGAMVPLRRSDSR